MEKYTGKTIDKVDIFAAELSYGGWDVWVLINNQWQFDNYYVELPTWL